MALLRRGRASCGAAADARPPPITETVIKIAAKARVNSSRCFLRPPVQWLLEFIDQYSYLKSQNSEYEGGVILTLAGLVGKHPV